MGILELIETIEVKNKTHLGTHLLCEYYECDANRIDNMDLISDALLEAAKRCKVTILEKSFHKFSPQGVSGVVVIAESHISIHTWPEHNYAAVDFFTCSEVCDTELIIDYLKNIFGSKRCESNKIMRGKIN